MDMDARTALMLRRSALLAGALLATLAAHAASEGGLPVVPVAPLLWLAVVLAGIRFLPARAGRPFRLRHPAAVAGAVVTAQSLLHTVLWAAPWILGVVPHHHCPFVTTTSVVTHAVAAAVLTALLLAGDRILEMALGVARVILGIRRPRCRPACAGLRVWASEQGVRPQAGARPRTSRGPPLPAAA